MQTKFFINKPNTFFLFGCGNLIVDYALKIKSYGFKVYVFSVPRQLEELLPDYNDSLETVLKNKNIPFYKEADINESETFFNLVTSNSIGIGMGENYTFNEKVLSAFNNNLYDFMTIRLPKFRGGAHFTWQILQGNKIGVWNIQRINKEMIPGKFDSGEIILSREFLLAESDKEPIDFFNKYENEANLLFEDFLRKIEENEEFSASFVQETFSSLFPRLNSKMQGYINWQWNLEEIKTFIDAFGEPYCGGISFINNQKVYLKNALIDYGEGSFHPFMNGIIYRIRNNKIYVAMSNGTLIIEKVLDEQNNDLVPTLNVGDRIYTPLKYLDEAMQLNIDYNAFGVVEN